MSENDPGAPHEPPPLIEPLAPTGDERGLDYRKIDVKKYGSSPLQDVFPKAISLPVNFWCSIDPHSITDDYIVPGFRAGTVGALIAPGGTGKSYLALELAMAVASSKADIAGFKPKSCGPVLYLNAEDAVKEIGQRLAFLGQKIPPPARKEIGIDLHVASTLGQLIDLGVKPRENSEPGDMTSIERLARYCKSFRLIIIDTLSRFHTLDENNNGQMSQLVSLLEYLAVETGASVLFLHHTNKMAIREAGGASQAAARGASALIDNVRFASYLVNMTEYEAQAHGVKPERRGSYVRYGIAKQNYGLLQPARWFERKEGGVLLPVDLFKNDPPSKKVKSNSTSKKGRSHGREEPL